MRNISNNEWKNEWKDMPEFVQEKKQPYKILTVRFANENDYDDFQKLIGQQLTPKTKSIWHPKLEPTDYSKLKYTDGAANES